MKLTSFTAISVVLAGFGVFAFCGQSDACTRSSPISLYATFTNADAIVRATAVAYSIPPEGRPSSFISFSTTLPASRKAQGSIVSPLEEIKIRARSL